MIQVINNKGAIIKDQINLGNIDNLNIDDLFKDNTSKKMKNNNYPNWLVPLETAKELKEIGFNEPTLFHYYENDFDVTIETNSYYDEGEAQGYLHFYISAFKEENFNRDKKCISLPTWEQVFEWFRGKGFESYIRLESHAHFDEGNYYYFEITKSNLRQLDWQGDFDDYNEAREALVKALIRTYKKEQL